MFESKFVFEDGYIKRLFAGRCKWLFRSDAVTLLKYDGLLSDAERENLRQVIAEYDQSEEKAA